ncbi:hypothetical protein LCGC14_2055610 [marine sediment metagenome]|uniref:AAA domain-containing protein n=1 Tax=marine sediment metagenome TaxID=412755 RepID=A0A0F9H169_9ZZZZ
MSKAILTLSMKGGVGKTTMSIGLARALQRRGHNVGVLDVDIHGSALPRAIGLVKEPGYETVVGRKLRPVAHEGLQIFSIGLIFSEEDANMWDGTMEEQAVQQVATLVDWDEDQDWLVVDTPPTSGDEVQSLLRHIPNVYGCIIVAQPNDLSILGLAKSLNLLRVTQTPICGILVNMALYTCPHCGETSNPFDSSPLAIQQLAIGHGVPFLGQVPFAVESERAIVMDQVIEKVLGHTPVLLPEEKVAITRHLMDFAVRGP